MHAHGRCCCANLFHYTSLPFGEGDVTARLVLDELDVDFPSLATRLVIVIIIIVGGGGNAWTFDASSVAVAIAGQRVVSPGAILSVGILNVGHVATGEMGCNSSCGSVVGLASGFDGRIGYDVDLGCGCYCVGLEIGVLVKGSFSSLGGNVGGGKQRPSRV